MSEIREPEITQPVDIHDEINAICEKLGLKASYVHRIEFEPASVVVHLFKGKEGRCASPKYVIGAGEPCQYVDGPDGPVPAPGFEDHGYAATETLTFAVRT